MPSPRAAKINVPAAGASRPALSLLRMQMSRTPDSPRSPAVPAVPAPPLPRTGQQRAYWRQPASASALAWSIAGAARAHGGPLLAVARDNQHANQLEADLRTLVGDDPTLPVLNFPDWETLPYDHFSPHPEIVSQRLATLHRLPALER